MREYPIKVLRHFAELNKQKDKPLFLAGRDLGKSVQNLKNTIKKDRKSVLFLKIWAISLLIVLIILSYFK